MTKISIVLTTAAVLACVLRHGLGPAAAVTHIDSSGVDALIDLARDLKSEEITLVIAELPERMLADLGEAGLVAVIGAERFYPTIAAALHAAVSE